jgi:putative ABC transport system permease protein
LSEWSANPGAELVIATHEADIARVIDRRIEISDGFILNRLWRKAIRDFWHERARTVLVVLRMGPTETTWHVVGLAREAFSPPVVYIPQSFIQQLHPGMVNNLRLALDKSDPDSISLVKASLDQNLEKQGVRPRGSISKAESRFGFDQHMLMIYVFLILTPAIIGGVGGLGLMTTMSLNVFERRREMGVMRALGATPRIIWLMIVAEGIVIGVLSWAIAALLAWPISKAIGDFILKIMFKSGLDFVFEPLGF